MREVSLLRAKPVFVDRSGRRGRLVKLIGAVVGGLLVVVLGLLGVAVSGASPLRVPGFPDAGNHAEGENATPAATPDAAQTSGPRPGPTSGSVVRPNPATPTASVTTSVPATKPGRTSHPAHPTPSKSK
jgi:hypothetical protein